jgi:hypothetical protein
LAPPPPRADIAGKFQARRRQREWTQRSYSA